MFNKNIKIMLMSCIMSVWSMQPVQPPSVDTILPHAVLVTPIPSTPHAAVSMITHADQASESAAVASRGATQRADSMNEHSGYPKAVVEDKGNWLVLLQNSSEFWTTYCDYKSLYYPLLILQITLSASMAIVGVLMYSQIKVPYIALILSTVCIIGSIIIPKITHFPAASVPIYGFSIGLICPTIVYLVYGYVLSEHFPLPHQTACRNGSS